ncbi:phage head completion protein [Streptobacillus canis]|uniref:phage head completion protein n=1 Tax=Streptobacillus canis TaxID=2678686 RepID=UPI0012E24FB0|nr:head-tail adaptor protein [Streptobacillus canis]
MNLTNKLNRKVQVLKYTKIKNSLGESTYEYIPFKKVYAQVMPLKNSLNDLNKESEEENSQYKFIIRKQSFKGLDVKCILELEGVKYSIDYWNLDFKSNEYIEIFATKKVKE